MIDSDALMRGLELLHQYTLGAHHASDNVNASEVFHAICHILEDMKRNITPGGEYYIMPVSVESLDG